MKAVLNTILALLIVFQSTLCSGNQGEKFENLILAEEAYDLLSKNVLSLDEWDKGPFDKNYWDKVNKIRKNRISTVLQKIKDIEKKVIEKEDNKNLSEKYRKYFLLNKQVIFQMRIILNITILNPDGEIPVAWLFKSVIENIDKILNLDEEIGNEIRNNN